MSRYVERTAFGIIGEILCTKCNSLIQCNMATNYSCFSYYYTRSMVYRKVVAYHGSRMYVYPGGRVGILGQHARYDRYTEHI